jgi:hypothetical protein
VTGSANPRDVADVTKVAGTGRFLPYDKDSCGGSGRAGGAVRGRGY